MPIDKKILREYRAGILTLQKELSFAEFQRVIDSKLIDFVFKNPTASITEIELAVNEIFGPEFSAYSTKSFGKYNGTVELVNDLYTNLGVDVQRDFQRIKVIEEINQTRLGKFGDNANRKLVKTVREGLTDKLTHKEFTEKIRQVDQTIAGYSETISKTQLKGYGRALKNEKANLAEVFYYEYVNPLHDNSRAFCIQHAGRTYHLDVINKLDNGPKQLKPVRTYCGGWNCNHDWEPDPFYIDD